ncbi:hypothetical protein SAMN05443287_1159 [Micromonospora phaseoli]|uniref:PE-PGRS family protein n=1 Tax=Micromonospora phaseoli TaxID=1144548 RepID=A0A1H7DL84_9ACTN|nr:DUF5954 family protein [Micromonospora phaseoli]PZV89410.1 hypothetical protein CLV64_11510 [Micromonospora phaseoli]GIJ81451.1 hypothetical protein Xph01_58830 [Micromonospora phaseoli]SEK02559.1 hypothetical protein SAMN05443287_1159 [Micromonospora phaseoli]
MSHDDPPPVAIVRVTRRDDPVGAVTEHDATRRAHAYPTIRVGAPLFGHAADLHGGRWQVHALFDDTPQDARNTLAHRLRERLLDTTDPALAAEVTTAGQILDRNKVNEVTVAGQAHRIIRADTFARFGPDGPEPPRPTDPDPRQFDDHDSFLDEQVIADPATPTGVGTAMLKVDLIAAHYPRAQVPPDVYADSVAAVHTHPDVVLLPSRYATAEHIDGSWQPITHAVATPQEARDELAFAFRYIEPRRSHLTPNQTTTYRRAADQLGDTPIDEITVLNRRFRITRIETLLRFSPEGPEGPRPSDHDPDPPPEAASRASA